MDMKSVTCFTNLPMYFKEVPNGMTMEDFCVNAFAAIHPPTYIQHQYEKPAPCEDIEYLLNNSRRNFYRETFHMLQRYVKSQ